MTIIKQFVKLLIITATFYCGTLSAEDEYPYQIDGVIDAVYLDKMILIIEDETYSIVPYTKIHPSGNYPGVYAVGNLAPRMNVGVKLEHVGNKSTITELWLLD